MTGHDFVRLSAQSMVDVKTIKRAYSGGDAAKKTRAITLERLRVAALALGLPLPPEAP
jgi:hypothetical protein